MNIRTLTNTLNMSINPLDLLEDAIINVNNIIIKSDGYTMLKSYYTPLSTIRDILQKAPFEYKLTLQIKYPDNYKKLKLILEKTK
jgi:hypothetical protein